MLRRSMIAAAAVLLAFPPAAPAEQASASPPRFLSGLTDLGDAHTCAILDDGSLRCWGWNVAGQLGHGSTSDVGDNEVPASAGPVDLGVGRSARAVSVGAAHTCVLLDDGTLRCWGSNGSGQLGQGNTNDVGDNETLLSVPPVYLGSGRTAREIAAGHGPYTCAILDDGSVKCWGVNGVGQLGYGHTDVVGDDETPGAMGPVNLGPGRTARALSPGEAHACAILDDGSVRCWGSNGHGQLGYGHTDNVGDNETPGAMGPVNLGPGRTARAIAAGGAHTCAILDDATVRCWGWNDVGTLGYGNTAKVGDDETPGSVGTVNLGPGRTARAIAAGGAHTCAILDDGSVRCWGYGLDGSLGYGNTAKVGDDETPGSVGTVNLGPGRTARAIAAGEAHTCALLDDGTLRCWGSGGSGRLGYGNTDTIGDNETPAGVGPVSLGRSIYVTGIPSLSSVVRPRRDVTPPVRLRASGALGLPAFAPPLDEACVGDVRIIVKRGNKRIRQALDDLEIVNGVCRYAKRFRIGEGAIGGAERLRVVARFLGNELLEPDAAPRRSIRVG